MAYRYVILGGGVAAGYAAQEFVKQEIGEHELCIVSADSVLPYERPPLSKAYLAGKKTREQILINPPEFYDQHKIDVQLRTRIERVDLGTRRLLDGEGGAIEFDKLLIATGSRVRTLDLPGGDLDGVHYLRSNADSDAIIADVERASRAVVVGGGYIGMEVGATLAGRGLDVTLVYQDDRLMERLFTPEMATFFEGYFKSQGVKLVPGQTASAFEGEGRVQRVTLDSGEALEADLVVVGVGVAPATSLFEGTGLHMQDGGIIVNKYLETNLSEIFVAGDVAHYYDVLFQKYRRIEHWDNAVQQGTHAARSMAGKRSEYMHIPYFFSDMFDLSWEFWGDRDDADQVIYRGDVAGGAFSAWWLDGRTVTAVFVMNRPDEERELGPEWIRMHQWVNPDALHNADQPLKVATQRFA